MVKAGLALRLTIPSLPPAVLSPNARVHWGARHQAAAQLKADVIALVKAQGWWRDPLDQARLTITWRSRDHRHRDFDNLLAATKPAIDGLVAAGVLWNDDTRMLTVSLGYEVDAETNETVMEVEAIHD